MIASRDRVPSDSVSYQSVTKWRSDGAVNAVRDEQVFVVMVSLAETDFSLIDSQQLRTLLL